MIIWNSANSREIVVKTTPVQASGTSRPASRRFRYSYLCRLIDDSELQDFHPAVRSELRRAHKQAYWKNLSLLRRDAAYVLKVRREMMGAQRDWNFNSLVSDYARVQVLLATLTMAGVSHSTRFSVGLERARVACSEFETMFTSSPLLAASASA
jgi:hypothetical protein